MRNSMVQGALILCMLFVAPSAHAQEESTDAISLFLKANESYQSGDYERARELYTAVLEGGVQNGKVYYNLGNAYFRLGRTGRAIQHYLLAREYIPRNRDLEANLKYAREEAEDQISPSSVETLLLEIFFWYHKMTVREMTYLFLACNMLLWGALSARLFVKRPVIHWVVGLSLCLGVIFGGTATVRLVRERLHKPAVIVVQTASVQSGTDPKSTTLFELHDGAEVRVEQTRQDWCLIRLPTGRKGWVQRDEIGPAVFSLE